MRPFGLMFAVMFLVSAFSESRTAECRVLLGGSSEEIGQSKNHGVDLRSKEFIGLVIRGYKRLRSLSSAGERMHTMASGPSRRGAVVKVELKLKQKTEKATMSTMKPSRSDEIPDPDQLIKNSNQIRADFDSLAPKRPTKPTRSEPEPPGSFSTSDQTTDHPEADKFRSLQSQTHGNILNEGGPSAIQDEFLETEYYTSLTAIDKQHHTTGSGFINVVKEDGGEEVVTAAAAIADGGEKAVYRSNPATNEWIPAVEEDLASEFSSKPNRSESS